MPYGRNVNLVGRYSESSVLQRRHETELTGNGGTLGWLVCWIFMLFPGVVVLHAKDY